MKIPPLYEVYDYGNAVFHLGLHCLPFEVPVCRVERSGSVARAFGDGSVASSRLTDGGPPSP